MFGFSAFADTPFASLPVVGQSYSVSITESVTASDAVLFNPDPGTWGYDGWGSGAWGGSVPSEIIEILTASDSQDAYTIYSAVIAESLSASDTQTYTVELNTYVIETLTASDAQTATYTLVGAVSENLAALAEQSSIANLVCSVLEAGNAVALIVGGGQFSVLINETVYAIDSVTARGLWEQIDDTQTANWGNIPTPQTANWDAVSTTQDPNWTPINT